MCLAVPGKIVELYASDNMKMAKISFEGVIREVCMEAIEDPKVGNYVIVHAGFALTMLNEEEAQETLRLLREMQAIEPDISTTVS